MEFSEIYFYIFLGAIFVLTILIILGFVRAIRGPKIADRIVAVNMIGTITITIIAFLSQMLGEDYLVDICIIYAAISFLAVIVLTKVYMGAFEENRRDKENKKNGLD